MPHSKLPGAGKSSFDLVDHELVFQELGLSQGKVFLDLGCGSGDYVIAAADIIGPERVIYAVDGWSDGIETLKQRALDKGFANITALIADITSHVPLPDNSVDICLMATVLHDFARDGGEKQALRETARILKHNGVLGIVEFKKIDGPPGPPIHIRLSPEEVADMMRPFGFQRIKTLDVGPFTYLTVASKMNR
jgi:ubiquinone/menaquinone biosynthesis C-methylase UbiE